VADRTWSQAFLSTAGLRIILLPLSAALTLTSAGLIIHFGGAVAFGFVTLVAQFRLALPFADLGLGAAVTRAVAKGESAPEQMHRAAALIIRTRWVLAVVGATGALVSALLGWAGIWSAVFTAPPTIRSDLDLTMTVALILFFVTLPLGLAERVLIGQDRATLLVLLGLLPGAMNLLFVLVAGAAGARPMWLAMGLPVAMVVFLAACHRAAFSAARSPMNTQRFPVPKAPLHQSDPLLVTMLAGLPVLLATAGMVLMEQHGRFVLAIVGTSAALSEYALALQLYMPIYSVMYMAGTVFWPRFAVAVERGLWVQANIALISLGCGAAVGYLAFARPLSRVVSGNELVLSWPVVITLALLFIAQSAHLTQVNLLTDRRGFWWQAAMSLGALLLVVPISVSAVRLGGGAASPAVAMIIAVTCFQAIPGLFIARRLVHRRFPTQEAESKRRPASA